MEGSRTGSHGQAGRRLDPKAGRAEHRGPPRCDLTKRELDVLCYLPTRLSNAEIGRRLEISGSTVKTHLKRIYLKLGVGCRNDAILVATGWKLIPTDLAEMLPHSSYSRY